MSEPFADVEEGVRTWLRTVPGLVGSAVYFGIPSETPSKFITVARIGGGPVAGKTVPQDAARLSLHVWGSTKKEAADVAKVLVSAVEGIESVALSSSVYAYGGVVDSVLWLPSSETQRPRYVVDVTITAGALEAVAP